MYILFILLLFRFVDLHIPQPRGIEPITIKKRNKTFWFWDVFFTLACRAIAWRFLFVFLFSPLKQKREMNFSSARRLAGDGRLTHHTHNQKEKKYYFI